MTLWPQQHRIQDKTASGGDERVLCSKCSQSDLGLEQHVTKPTCSLQMSPASAAVLPRTAISEVAQRDPLT